MHLLTRKFLTSPAQVLRRRRDLVVQVALPKFGKRLIELAVGIVRRVLPGPPDIVPNSRIRPSRRSSPVRECRRTRLSVVTSCRRRCDTAGTSIPALRHASTVVRDTPSNLAATATDTPGSIWRHV
jgi:hypothetical protein